MLRKEYWNKTKCYVPQSVLRNVYIFRLSSSVFVLWSYILGERCFNLHSEDTSLTKLHCQNHYSYVLFQNKTLPLCIQLNLTKLKDIYELEVLKFVYKFIKNYLPKCFNNYFLRASKICNYSNRFASEHNWVSAMRCSKTLSQQSIKIKGHRL